MKSQSLRRVRQFVEENPAFSEGSVRWLIHNSANNGLDAHKAIVRIGGSVYINPEGFNSWLESQSEHPRKVRHG